jgi:lipopolysaccharide export system protein LptA
MSTLNWKVWLSAALLTASSMANALPEDRKQPIHISADSAQIDEKAGVTTYTGNVSITQGTMKIRAAKVSLYQKDRAVDRIVATGSPAKFSQQAAANQAITDAYGNSLEYLVKKQTITLSGNAKVEQEKNQFSGERIVYQMDKARVNAYGGKDSGQRVQMIIQPNGN